MRLTHLLLLSAIAAAPGAFIPGRASAAGESGFAFLKVGIGARAMGMGGAYVAEANDPTAVYWNPAGLSGLGGTQVTFMHNEWIQDFRQDFAGVAVPAFARGAGGIAVGLSTFYSDELERRSDTGVLLGHFGFNDLLATGSVAYPITPAFTGGLSAKYVREMIDQENAASVAFDIGGRYVVPRTAFALAAAVQNVGTDAKFETESFGLPRTIRVGASNEWSFATAHSGARLSGEFRKSTGEDSRVQLGGEFTYKETASLRAGYKFGYDEERASFGLGLSRDRFTFDYALVPLSADLGSTHFFSLTARL
ncbi:MAG TPA: PorV/PorQ family protein [Candidatus Eisenbacteria bacterium]|jgi:hypothetical protein